MTAAPDWETHWLGDVEYFVRCRPWSVTHSIGMKFEAFEGVGWQCSDGPAGWPEDVAYAVWQRNYKGSGDLTTVEYLDEAHRQVQGRVSWDGEGHLYFGEPQDEGYLYCGELRYATRVGMLLSHLWRLAWEFYLQESPGSRQEDFGLAKEPR